MDELSAEENELINVYKTLLLTVKQVIRPEHKELLNNVPLAIIKCVTTMEFRIVKSPEMVNMTKRLIEDLPNMEYADVLKELKIYVDELKRRRDVVVSGGDAGTVEWIKLKNRSIVATKQPMDMKSRDEITAALIKATRLLQKEMTKPLEWNRSDCRTIEKLERKIEILRNRLAASEGMSTSTGRYSMETPPEFASCGFAQIDNAVRELLNQCFPVGKTFGTRGRLVVRCPCHWEIKETVVRASQEHSLGLSNQMIDDIAAKLAVDIGVAIKQKERIDFELYLQDTASCYGLSETVPHDDIASVDFGGGDKNEQAADHPTEEKGPLDAKVDKVTEGKSDSQKEISKILDTVKVNVPKRRIVLSDPFIPEAGVSTVKTSDEQNLGKRKKKRKQNRQKVKEVAPAEKSKKRESADSSGCASKILQGNDRTGQRASLRNSAKRCGRRLKAKSRRLNEQTNPPLVEKHGADTHSLESAFKPQTRSSTSKASTSVSCSTVQNSLHDDHRQPTKGPNNRQHREKLVKAAPSQDCPEIIDLTFDD